MAYFDSMHSKYGKKMMEEIYKTDSDFMENDWNYNGVLIDKLIHIGKSKLAKKILSDFDEEKIIGHEYQNSYAYNHYKIGDALKGIKHIEKAIEIKDNLPHYLDTYACLLSKSKRDGDAINTFKKAFDLATNSNQITWDELKSLLHRNEMDEKYSEMKKKFEEN